MTRPLKHRFAVWLVKLGASMLPEPAASCIYSQLHNWYRVSKRTWLS